MNFDMKDIQGKNSRLEVPSMWLHEWGKGRKEEIIFQAQKEKKSTRSEEKSNKISKKTQRNKDGTEKCRKQTLGLPPGQKGKSTATAKPGSRGDNRLTVPATEDIYGSCNP